MAGNVIMKLVPKENKKGNGDRMERKRKERDR